MPAMIQKIIKTARPEQWLKNGFVLAPLFFSGNLLNAGKYMATATACLAFCLASSAIYFLNDVMDRHSDRLHPLKSRRPVAAGSLNVTTALVTAAILGSASLILGLSINGITAGVIFGYIIIACAYCVVLKHIVVADVITIALGFILRGTAGATAIGVIVSPWLILCTFCLAVFLSLCKRYHEIQSLGVLADEHRDVLSDYTKGFLLGLTLAAALATLVAYACYTAFPFFTPYASRAARLPWTIPFVALGLIRYGFIAIREHKAGTPTEALLTDWQLLSIIGGWAITLYIIFIMP